MKFQLLLFILLIIGLSSCSNKKKVHNFDLLTLNHLEEILQYHHQSSLQTMIGFEEQMKNNPSETKIYYSSAKVVNYLGLSLIEYIDSLKRRSGRKNFTDEVYHRLASEIENSNEQCSLNLSQLKMHKKFYLTKKSETETIEWINGSLKELEKTRAIISLTQVQIEIAVSKNSILNELLYCTHAGDFNDSWGPIPIIQIDKHVIYKNDICSASVILGDYAPNYKTKLILNNYQLTADHGKYTLIPYTGKKGFFQLNGTFSVINDKRNLTFPICLEYLVK
jgi:hypothetical protein